MINQIVNLYLSIENVIGVKYCPASKVFIIIFSEDSDNIANILAQKDNDVYNLYPEYDHEINYTISKNISLFTNSSDGKLYIK